MCITAHHTLLCILTCTTLTRTNTTLTRTNTTTAPITCTTPHSHTACRGTHLPPLKSHPAPHLQEHTSKNVPLEVVEGVKHHAGETAVAMHAPLLCYAACPLAVLPSGLHPCCVPRASCAPACGPPGLARQHPIYLITHICVHAPPPPTHTHTTIHT